MTVNVSTAKAQLSKLIDLVHHGESVTIAKNNLPLVDLVPHKPRGIRELGMLEGQIQTSADFDKENAEINSMFYEGEK